MNGSQARESIKRIFASGETLSGFYAFIVFYA